jgi:arylsulfatase A
MTSPHTPINPSPQFQGKSGVSKYADFIMETDWCVGQIMQALDQHKLSNNTLLIFTADNGTSPKCNFGELEQKNVHLREHWRGHKADIWEGGHRFSLPDNAAEDSVSLLPLLKGQTIVSSRRKAIVCHSSNGYFAVRKGKWKVEFCAGSGGWSAPRGKQAEKMGLPAVQLYDLEADPKEQHNVYSRHPQVVEELRALLKQYVTQGRSTPGRPQKNEGPKHWKQLPWENK